MFGWQVETEREKSSKGMGRCPLLKVSALVQGVGARIACCSSFLLKNHPQSILCECILVCPRQNLLDELMPKTETP